MITNWQTVVQPHDRSSILPPAAMDEAGWDILVALHSDKRGQLSLQKLARLTSLPDPTLIQWLATLERRGLIRGAEHELNHEMCAVLTASGRELLDRYLSAASDLQFGSRH